MNTNDAINGGWRTRWLTWSIVASLLLIHAGLVLYSLRHNFVTVDEVGHLAAGVAHWETGDYSPYRVNPPLVRMLATLPVLAAKPTTDYSQLRDVPGLRSEWQLGQDFIKANADRYFDLMCLARLAGVAWSMLGGLLVFCWARELYGIGGGFLALLLWCFSPTVLAFAQFIVTDVPASVAGLAAFVSTTAAGSCRPYSDPHFPSRRSLLLVGMCLPGVIQKSTREIATAFFAVKRS